MDSIDLKLLTLLQKNARTPLKVLAEQVFLSSPATAARIDKLEKEGIIDGYTVKLNNKKLDLPIVAFIHLELDPKQKPTFYPFVQSHPNVVECNCVTGRFSQLLKVVFDSTESLDGFVGELNNFGHTETQISFSSSKDTNGVGVEELFSKE